MVHPSGCAVFFSDWNNDAFQAMASGARRKIFNIMSSGLLFMHVKSNICVACYQQVGIQISNWGFRIHFIFEGQIQDSN